MTVHSNVTISKRVFFTVLTALFILSAFNTVLIFWRTSGPVDTSAVSYEYVLSQLSDGYILKDMASGFSTIFPQSASSALNMALDKGKTVYINPGNYTLTSDVVLANKFNSKIASDGATLYGQGHKIIVSGDDYTTSKYATISGFTFINGTIRVEDSFASTIQNILFVNTSCAIEFANLNTWSEYNQIANCQFINATEGIAFRSPVGNATGSYESSEISRCSFNIRDNSIGIKVEAKTQFSSSLLQNVRFWLGEDGSTNQTGILNNGSMDQTLLQDVVFESFAAEPHDLFGIDLGADCNPAPLLDGAVTFLGNWTARIHNPYCKWVNGLGSVFAKTNQNVPVGVGGEYGNTLSISMYPLKILNFKPKIQVSGLASDETITVRIRFEYMDNIISKSVEKTLGSNQAVWLSDDDMLQLYPSQSVIYAVLVDAKSNQATSNAQVTVSGYGNAG